ncbi:hypothetical protein JW916_13750 [Candidatus Sumerlaeota bacterium]|nr:hypothetical protein [Candidatus Sumerlaeota bacterium]
MKTLSDATTETLMLLDDGKTAEAFKVFRTRYVMTIKEFYTEAASVYPVRFSKIQQWQDRDWCSWTRRLYLLAGSADRALRAGDAEMGRNLLGDLRAHFDTLHTVTGVMKSNDWIYEFMTETTAEAPSVDTLKNLKGELEKAEPSAQAKAEPEKYREAVAAWTAAVDPVLADGKIEAGEMEGLRSAAKVLYRAYGVQYE